MTKINTDKKGRFWLSIARYAWFGVTALLLVIFISGLKPRYDELTTVCIEVPCVALALTQPDVDALPELGLSLHAYGLFHVLLEIFVDIPIVLLGFVIFWQRRNDWMGLLVSFALITFGLNFMVESDLAFIRFYPQYQTAFDILTSLAGVPFVIILFLFPDGRFVPDRSRWLVIVLTVFAALNPVLSVFGTLPSGQFSLIYIAGFLGGLVFGIGAQVYRYRNISTQAERQQTKWIVLAFSGFLIVVVGWTFLIEIAPPEPGITTLFVNIGFFVLASPIFWFFPIAVMFSILRYRLWDIDLVIRRTLTYAMLTGLLALVYFGSVVVFQNLFVGITGQQSQIVIVLSTLSIAALFNPLRIRIQDFIDRRFFRAKYDAEQTLEAFAAMARDEVDMNRLTGALLGAVEDTMQPEQTSLWIKQ